MQKTVALPKWPTESDISCRIPFETNLYFKSSRTPALRYVAAGGNLSLSERPAVDLDLVPRNYKSFSMGKDELLASLPSVTAHKQCIALVDQSKPLKLGRTRSKLEVIKASPRRLKKAFGDVLGNV
jgi:hypothetical protein